MTNILAVAVGVLLLLIGVALLDFEIFTRVFHSVYSRMFLGKRPESRHEYTALVVLVVLYAALKMRSHYH